VTGNLSILNKNIQREDKLTTEMSANIKGLQVNRSLQQNQLKMHNPVHFPHLKSLTTTSPEVFPSGIHEYSRGIFLLHDELKKQIQGFKLMEPELMLSAHTKTKKEYSYTSTPPLGLHVLLLGQIYHAGVKGMKRQNTDHRRQRRNSFK
jgi:hypothetical protein